VQSQSSAILRFLKDHNLLSSRDLVNSRVTIIPELRERYTIGTVVKNDMVQCVVKCALPDQSAEKLMHEMAVCQLINAQSVVKLIAPAVLAQDAVGSIAATTFAGEAASLLTDRQRTQTVSVLAESLYALHQLRSFTAGETNENNGALPWIFTELATRDHISHYPAIAMELSTLNVPSLSNAAMKLWAPQSRIHGDLKWEHFRIQQSNQGLRLCLIDWELSCVGDPAWDLACVLNELLLEQITNAQLNEILMQPSYWDTSTNFLSQYDPNTLNERKLLHRVVFFLGARIIQTCLETSVANNAASLSPELIRLAVVLMQQPKMIAEKLHYWKKACA